MSYHNKTDGIGQSPSDAIPPDSREVDTSVDFLVRAKPRNERMANDKIECNACPVLCQISPGKVGACDRYANQDGFLLRVDPVVILRKNLTEGSTVAVPFLGNRPQENPDSETPPAWSGDLLLANESFVT